VDPFRAFLLNSWRSHKNWHLWLCSGHFKCFVFFHKYFFVLKILKFLPFVAVLLTFNFFCFSQMFWFLSFMAVLWTVSNCNFHKVLWNCVWGDTSSVWGRSFNICDLGGQQSKNVWQSSLLYKTEYTWLQISNRYATCVIEIKIFRSHILIRNCQKVVSPFVLLNLSFNQSSIQS
jgi:hypothetical protein